MNRYQKIFESLKKNKSGAFVPFITVGDPNPINFIDIIDTLIKSGSDALELGIPFSDPLSDGPEIQKSIQRAFKSGINVANSFKLIKKIREKHPYCPIGLLIYANLIFKHGINNFYAHCSTLDIDSVLIPDLPIEESLPFYNAATYHKIAHIFICPPNASNNLIKKITNQGNGYIYLLSRPGITGIHTTQFDTTILKTLIQYIQKQKRILPILQGFGVHTSQHAHESFLLGTSGVILGSAIAKIIEEHHLCVKSLLKKIEILVQLIKNAMRL